MVSTMPVRWFHSTGISTIRGQERITLETYIQMACFDRIIGKAKLRLLKIMDNQYELKRRESTDSRQGKFGLDPDVIDHHNGSTRSANSLSGGETFMASLALGMADEVQSSAGGIQPDSLFVDEGFGTLDDEALEQAANSSTGGQKTRNGSGVTVPMEHAKGLVPADPEPKTAETNRFRLINESLTANC